MMETTLTKHDHDEIRYVRQMLTQTIDYLGQLDRGELPRGMKARNPESQRLSLIAAHCEFAAHKMDLAVRRAKKREAR